MKAKRRSCRPADGFRTMDEEVAYWGRHGSDADAGVRPVAFRVDPKARSRMISIRLPADLLDAIRKEARRRKVPYQRLIKLWLRVAIRAESGGGGSNIVGDGSTDKLCRLIGF